MIRSRFEIEMIVMCDDIVYEKTLVVGHKARRLNKPVDGATHQWELFMYSPDGEDLTKWIDKCVFALHEDFKPPEREYTKEPYLVSEQGWGVFPARVIIYPKDTSPFEIQHYITFPQQNSRRPTIINRVYQRIIFRNPSPRLFEGLSLAPYTWNKYKRMKRLTKSQDIDILDYTASDPILERKWMKMITQTSQNIREQISACQKEYEARLHRIRFLLDEIGKDSPDLKELAGLLI